MASALAALARQYSSAQTDRLDQWKAQRRGGRGHGAWWRSLNRRSVIQTHTSEDDHSWCCDERFIVTSIRSKWNAAKQDGKGRFDSSREEDKAHLRCSTTSLISFSKGFPTLYCCAFLRQCAFSYNNENHFGAELETRMQRFYALRTEIAVHMNAKLIQPDSVWHCETVSPPSEKSRGDSCSHRLQDFTNCTYKIIWVQLLARRSWWCSVRWEAPLRSALTLSSEVHRSPARDISCTRAIPCLCHTGRWCCLHLHRPLLQACLRALCPRPIRTTRSRAYPAGSAPVWRRACSRPL